MDSIKNQRLHIHRCAFRPRLSLICLLLTLLACSGSGAPHDGTETAPKPAVEAAPEQTVQEQAWQQIRANALLIDVRTPAEFDQGHLEGAANIPYDQLKARVAEFGEDRDRQIVLYCRTGRRSGIGEKTLGELGFTRVLNAGSYQSLLQTQ